MPTARGTEGKAATGREVFSLGMETVYSTLHGTALGSLEAEGCIAFTWGNNTLARLSDH